MVTILMKNLWIYLNRQRMQPWIPTRGRRQPVPWENKKGYSTWSVKWVGDPRRNFEWGRSVPTTKIRKQVNLYENNVKSDMVWDFDNDRGFYSPIGMTDFFYGTPEEGENKLVRV